MDAVFTGTTYGFRIEKPHFLPISSKKKMLWIPMSSLRVPHTFSSLRLCISLLASSNIISCRIRYLV